MKKPLLLTLFLFTSFVHAQTTSANFSSNAQLNGSCFVETQPIDLSSNISSTISLGSHIFITCSKDLLMQASFTNDHFSSTNLNHFYLIGNNPFNSDKIVISFKNDGTFLPGTVIGTGLRESLKIGPAIPSLVPQGSMINDEFKTNNYKITPDTYSSNFTILLAY